jgi:hypothetical protein
MKLKKIWENYNLKCFSPVSAPPTNAPGDMPERRAFEPRLHHKRKLLCNFKVCNFKITQPVFTQKIFLKKPGCPRVAFGYLL